jgi:tripartite-type tricarboxylate transporter receptor subunit TctC
MARPHPSCLLAVLLCASNVGALAQDYPARPVRVLVGFAPGGTVDIVARLVMPKVSEALGQTVIVDNRAGASGNIATELCARAAPDGYTTLLVNPALAISASAYRRLGYDAMRDLAPVGMVANSSHLLIVHPSLPVHTVKQLIALAKARPGQLNFSSGGQGNADHLPGELLKFMTGIDIVHIPYKGGAPAAADLVAGQVSMYFAGIAVGLPLAKAGRARGLAVTTRRRSPLAPDMPTMDEAGVPGFETALWVGMFAPAGTPPAIVARLNTEVRKAVNAPELRDRLIAIGAEPFAGTPEELGSYLRNEIDKYGKVVRAIGLKID